jgi:hypothetical protein
MVDEALAAEEQALLRSIGEDRGYIDEALGLFAGRNGWVNGVLMVLQAVLFFGGVWAAWQFFIADTVLIALRWGLPAAVALITAVAIKMALYPIVHLQRLLRELKRIELVLAARLPS